MDLNAFIKANIYQPAYSPEPSLSAYGRPKPERRNPNKPRIPSLELTDAGRKRVIQEGFGSKAVGALGAIGSFMDIPGSMIRDTLALATGLPANPLNQLLPRNWTDPRSRWRGVDLMRAWDKNLGTRMMSRHRTWGNEGAGLLFEIATDPLTYLGVGLLGKGVKFLPTATKLGRIAKAADLLRPEIISRAARLSGMGEREFLHAGKLTDLLKSAKFFEEQAPHLFPNSGFSRLMRVAKEYGLDSKAIRDMATSGQGFRAPFRFGLPAFKFLGERGLQRSPSILVGAGSNWGRRWARGLDKFGDKLLTLPISRDVLSLFNASHLGSRSSDISAIKRAREAYNWETHVRAGNRSLVSKLVNEWARSSDIPIGEAKRIREAILTGKVSDPQLEPLLNTIYSALDNTFEFARRGGAKLEPLQDLELQRFFTRQMTAPAQRMVQDSKQTMLRQLLHNAEGSPFTVHELQRQGILKDVKGADTTINEMFTDKTIRAIIADAKRRGVPLNSEQVINKISSVITEKYGSRVPDWYRGGQLSPIDFLSESKQNNQALAYAMMDYTHPDATAAQRAAAMDKILELGFIPHTDPKMIKTPLTDPEHTGVWRMVRKGRRKELAKMIVNAPDVIHERGLFGNHPFSDLLRYMDSVTSKGIRGHMTLDTIAETIAKENRGGGLTVGRLLDDLGMDKERAYEGLMERLGKIHPELKPDELKERVLNWRLPKDIARDIERTVPNPEKLADISTPMRWYDDLVAAFKANVTSPFPAFHFRNFMSALLQNWMAGQFTMRSTRDALRLLRGKTVEGAAEIPWVVKEWARRKAANPAMYRSLKLTDEEATNMIREQAFVHNLVGKYGGKTGTASGTPGMQAAENVSMSDLAADEAGTIEELGAGMAGATHLPGGKAFSFKDMAKGYVGARDDTRLRGHVSPVPFLSAPFYGGKKAYYLTRKAMGKEAKNPAFWKEPVWHKVAGTIDPGTGAVRTTSEFGPVVGGAEAAHITEGTVRIAPLIKLMREGYDPATAARQIMDAQFRYSNRAFTPFERKWMRRLFPFYSFQRQALPWAVSYQATHPGGVMTQIQRAALAARDPMRPVPDYIADTPAIEIPKRLSWFAAQRPGWSSYLSGFSTMQEDPWKIAAPILQLKPSQMLFELGGRMAPIPKALVEQATGTSLYQRSTNTGRPLVKMDPTLGRVAANTAYWMNRAFGVKYNPEDIRRWRTPDWFETVFGYSPLSRYGSFVRTLTGPAKSPGAKFTNLLTGIRITDLSPSARDAMIQEALAEELRKMGGGVFTKPNLPVDVYLQLSPEEKKRARLITAYLAEQAKRKRELQKQTQIGALVD